MDVVSTDDNEVPFGSPTGTLEAKLNGAFVAKIDVLTPTRLSRRGSFTTSFWVRKGLTPFLDVDVLDVFLEGCCLCAMFDSQANVLTWTMARFDVGISLWFVIAMWADEIVVH